MKDFQIRDRVYPGLTVKVAVKRNGHYSPNLYEGIVDRVLTKTSEHYRGIKVVLRDGTVGRVQEIIE